jgi:hypothetical protein
MPGLRAYRFYLIDAQSHIAKAQVVMCRDDDAAALRAREILAANPSCHGVEAWELDRRVCVHSFDATAQSDAAQ